MVSIPKGSRSVGQIVRQQGTSSCSICYCAISGNKLFCKAHTPKESDNVVTLKERLQRTL